MKRTKNERFNLVIPSVVFNNKTISAKEKLLFAALVHIAGDSNSCTPSNAFLGEFMKVHKNTISGMLAKLKREELIELKYDIVSYDGEQIRTIYNIYGKGGAI